MVSFKFHNTFHNFHSFQYLRTHNVRNELFTLIVVLFLFETSFNNTPATSINTLIRLWYKIFRALYLKKIVSMAAPILHSLLYYNVELANQKSQASLFFTGTNRISVLIYISTTKKKTSIVSKYRYNQTLKRCAVENASKFGSL